MNKTKMTFLLEKDEDGYPPDDSETLWVEELVDGNYRVDNIPFYIRGISPDDVVSGELCGGVLLYKSLVRRSTISVLRVIFFHSDHAARVLKGLVDCGCRWEGSHLPNFYSIEAPNSCAHECAEKLLAQEVSNDVLDYEESSLR